MSIMSLRSKRASVVWVDSNYICADGSCHSFFEANMMQQLVQVMVALPIKRTSWIIDDAWAPSLLLREIIEVPSDTSVRESFFRWRYTQDLALDIPMVVQSLDLGSNIWLLSGIQQGHLDTWNQLAKTSGCSICRLMPRWAWLYNYLAPTLEVPGLLLSLAAVGNEMFTGTLVAWKDSLVLLRQWTDSAPIEVWNNERILPSIAYLQREGCLPQKLYIWGSSHWPDCGISIQIIRIEIPTWEAT